jgi:NAD(P)-dependent dehydrogenase (short-subunit alcohol dehydrogenase family)
MESVRGLRVLITGAARGMGRLYAERALRETAQVVELWDHDAAALQQCVEELRTLWPERAGMLIPVRVDLARPEQIAAAAAAAIGRWGGVDVLINNAGIVRGAWFWEHELESDIQGTLAINTLAPMLLSRALLPGMIARGSPARILNVASAAGLLANPRMSVYCASKWAMVGWSDSLRLELRRAGHREPRVTTLCPSYVNTGMFQGVRAPLLTPILRPQDVVDAAWKAMLAGQAWRTLPWTVRLSMAARGLLPARLWDFVAGSVFGVYGSMDRFRGHADSESPR